MVSPSDPRAVTGSMVSSASTIQIPSRFLTAPATGTVVLALGAPPSAVFASRSARLCSAAAYWPLDSVQAELCPARRSDRRCAARVPPPARPPLLGRSAAVRPCRPVPPALHSIRGPGQSAFRQYRNAIAPRIAEPYRHLSRCISPTVLYRLPYDVRRQTGRTASIHGGAIQPEIGITSMSSTSATVGVALTGSNGVQTRTQPYWPS